MKRPLSEEAKIDEPEEAQRESPSPSPSLPWSVPFHSLLNWPTSSHSAVTAVV